MDTNTFQAVISNLNEVPIWWCMACDHCTVCGHKLDLKTLLISLLSEFTVRLKVCHCYKALLEWHLHMVPFGLEKKQLIVTPFPFYRLLTVHPFIFLWNINKAHQSSFYPDVNKCIRHGAFYKCSSMQWWVYHLFFWSTLREKKSHISGMPPSSMELMK